MHVRDERRMFLPETHEYPSFPGDILDRKPCPASIVPVRARDRFEPAPGMDVADSLQVVLQGPELDVPLLRGTDVLQRTAATTAENCAARVDTFGRCLDNLQEFRLIELASGFAALKPDGFAHESAGHEDLLAGGIGNAPTVVRYRLDAGRLRFTLSPHHSGQASRNSLRCG